MAVEEYRDKYDPGLAWRIKQATYSGRSAILGRMYSKFTLTKGGAIWERSGQILSFTIRYAHATDQEAGRIFMEKDVNDSFFSVSFSWSPESPDDEQIPARARRGARLLFVGARRIYKQRRWRHNLLAALWLRKPLTD